MKVLVEPTKKQIIEIVNQRKVSFSEIEQSVRTVIEEVRKNGQTALEKYIATYEKCVLKGEQIVVSKEELESAQVEDEFKHTCERFIERVMNFHSIQIERSKWSLTQHGSVVGYLVRPIDSVAIYVPSGKKVYFTTLMMCAIPAKIAGVRRIVVACPPNEEGRVSPHVLYLCRRLGIEEIYKMGGAHAIAALAYGTEIVKKVDKIVGPGSVYVSCAKKLVFGDCGIDSIAGPTEVLIVADSSANPKFLAADLLAQAEHDEMAMSVLITNDEDVLDKTLEELAKQLKELPEPNRSIARASLERNGIVILTRNLSEALEFVNLFAPEHLQLSIKDPWSAMTELKNAASVFLGTHSAEAFGDYGIGPNHVLPTSTSARFSSGLSVQDFLKKIFVTQVSAEEVLSEGRFYSILARLEGFEAHARSIETRMGGSK